MVLYWDMDGEPIRDVRTWAKLYEDFEGRVVASKQVGHFWVVSVWTGLDWGLDDSKVIRPLIYSTALLRRPAKVVVGNAIEELHAPSREGALAHHDQLVENAKELMRRELA